MTRSATVHPNRIMLLYLIKQVTQFKQRRWI